MRIWFPKIPVDLLLCLAGSVILVLLALFDVENPLRLILGMSFILFIPGYVLVFALFPFNRPGDGISIIERIGLSLGVSVAIVPLIGLALNFLSWRLRLQPLLLVLSVFIFGVGIVAFYRWSVTVPEKRFCVSFDFRFPSFKNRVDKVVTLVLAVLIISSIFLLVYVIVVPKIGEKFTEFYVLGVNGTADQYPQNLRVGENTSVILGISNHEYRKMNYTIQVWLINQTRSYNTTEKKNDTVINHMWFIDEINIILNHTLLNLDILEEPQWMDNYIFSLNRTGFFKIAFLLSTTPVSNYTSDVDYMENADQIMSSAYRNLHLWVNVN